MTRKRTPPQSASRPTAGRVRPRAAATPEPRAHALGRTSWLPAVAFLVWLALVVALVLHHEPWRDEADTWLATRDLSLAGLWRFAGYVGSPLLWYWLQMPLAQLGAPYMSLGFLNAACAAAGVALFLWQAPFPWWIRVLFAFSYFGAYEYAVIARSYALSMALLFGLAALDRSRRQRPILYGTLLALLLNTNVHSVVLGSTLLVAFAWGAIRTRGEALAGAAIAAVGLALAIVQLVPPADGQLQGLAGSLDWTRVSTTLAGALFPTAETSAVAIAAAWVLWLAALATLLRSPRALFVMMASSAGLWLLFVLKYLGELRHWGFLLLAMVYALWIAREDAAAARAATPGAEPGAEAGAGASAATSTDAAGRSPRDARTLAQAARRVLEIGLGIALAWSVYVATQFWRRDWQDPFSASKAVARHLEANGLTRMPIAAWPAPHAEAVLPHLPGVRFWYAGTREWGTHMTWTRECVAGFDLPEDEVLRRVIDAFPSGGVLLVNRPLRGAERAGYRLVHAEIGDVMMGDEQYFVYRR